MRKFIDSISLDDYQIETENGWEDIEYLHKTVEYNIWYIELQNGLYLECADNHILIDENYNEIFVKDCIASKTKIRTKYGISTVKIVKKTNKTENMYDFSLYGGSHTYYTNNVLSHNTTTAASFILWNINFKDYYRICALANTEKNAKEIVEKVKIIYENLPFWMKQGVTKWDVFSIKFENGSKLECSPTTANSGRGFSYNCVTGDNKVTIKNNENGDVYDVTVDELNLFMNMDDIFIDNKYLSIYKRFVLKFKNRTIKRGDYYEKHHIIPKSIGGNNDSINLIKLSLVEHLFMHKLLIKITCDDNKRKMAYAYHKMVHNYKKYPNLSDYERSRSKIHLVGYHHSKETKQKISKSNKGKTLGRKLSEDTRKKISEKNRGKIISDEVRKKMSEAQKGKKIPDHIVDKVNRNPDKIRKTAEKHRGMKRSEESKLKMSMAKKGRPSLNKGKKYIHNIETGEIKLVDKNYECPKGYMNGYGKRNKKK